MSDDSETFDVRNLEKLIRALKKGGNAQVVIGIMGNNGARSDGELNNATIGAFHEFGTSKMPQRSFLKMPITEHLGHELEQSGAFDEKTLKKVLSEGTMQEWLQKVAVCAEGVVQDAFDTEGFGKWEPSNMSHKKNQQTLVETTQLRNSITTKITGVS